MATAEKTRTTNTDYTNFETYTQAWKDMMGFQMRTSKTIIDQGMTFTKKAAEHMSTQLNESMKLQQDAMKYGLTMMEDFKKVLFESTDKTFKPEGH